jgi:hypothetical protein
MRTQWELFALADMCDPQTLTNGGQVVNTGVWDGQGMGNDTLKIFRDGVGWCGMVWDGVGCVRALGWLVAKGLGLWGETRVTREGESYRETRCEQQAGYVNSIPHVPN